jgi:2,4-dienoyl-CoA reductase-like NADH-dependent reductase (Old Yellow Enzyme family)
MPKRYFNYQTLADLRRDAERLKVELPLIEDAEEIRRILAKPVRISSQEREWRVGNSLAVHPMEGCDGELDGRPGELTFRRYRRFGGGGAKLIWFEACAVVEEGRANPRQLWIHAGSARALAQLLAECRRTHEREFGSCEDLVCILQLTHSGRYSFRDKLVAYHHPVLNAYPYANLSTLPSRREPWTLASDKYLAALEDRFVEAARWAQEIGFDGVDIKMTHGYLLSELLSARVRPGPYGGSLENRARFALNVLRKVRARLGKDFLLVVRLGVYDGVPYAVAPACAGRPGDAAGVPRPYPLPYEWGFGVNRDNPLEIDLEEPLRLIAWLRRAGVGILNVSMGIASVNPHLGRPYEKPNEGSYEPPEHPLHGVARHFAVAARIQQAFPDLVVVGSGYSWLRHFLIHAGAANLQLGRATMVGVGRGSLAYPQWARDALTKGMLDPLRTCKTLSFCTYLMRQKNHPLGQFPTGCPPFDKEGYGRIVKEARAKSREQVAGDREQKAESRRQKAEL